MNEKLSWVLQYHHNLFHADLIQNAISDDTIDISTFMQGYEKICIAERDTDDDEFVPAEFSNL